MKRRALLLALTIVVTSTPSARAQFADMEVGARGLAMGGAFVAVDGDPSSLFWNPAAIHSARRVQISGMRTRLFDGLEGVTEDFLGVTARVNDEFTAGFGWTRTGLEDVYHEDLLNLALAWHAPLEGLSLGASLLMYGAAAPGYEDLNDPNYAGGQWEPSFSVGALYRLTAALQVGFSAENLLRPEISLLSNSNDVDPIGGRRRLGVSYVVQEIVRLVAEVRHHDFPDYYESEVTFHAGAESWFQDVLALRVGIDDGALAAGAGIVVRNVRFDGGLVTHERLGNTFRAAITLGY